MKLVAIVSWYDEPAEWLAACCASLCQAGVGHIVAVDGAYEAYPQGSVYPRSGAEQYAAITETCHAMQAGSTVYGPGSAWRGNEVEKRSYAFRLAELVADPGDWYWVMDADQVVNTKTSDGLLDTLAIADVDVAETWLYERNALNDPTRASIRNLFRAIPGLRVVGNHYTYMTPDGRFLWGDGGPSRLEPSLVTSVEVEHRTWLRPRARRDKQNDYYRRRDMTQAEHMVVDMEVTF